MSLQNKYKVNHHRIRVIDKDKSEEEKESPKEKEHEAIQTLVNFPTTRTPIML